jgi:hypothetical protein
VALAVVLFFLAFAGEGDKAALISGILFTGGSLALFFALSKRGGNQPPSN